ncbi:MAG: signal recognition particle-docking protein FtsY [Deltaproteobacteria bacterium]|nr:signal recognition particle-docking protein FtsY [Candidatus Zymogenaceae bacterium]
MTKDRFFSRLVSGLTKTRTLISDNLDSVDMIIGNRKGWDDEVWEGLEELLLTADAGLAITEKVLENLRRWAKKHGPSPEELRGELKKQLGAILEGAEGELSKNGAPPTVVLVVGVNGTGKTTTIAKIAGRIAASGGSVMLAAGDTFRDAAIEQLQQWGDRLGVEVIAQKQGADPAAVAFDALNHARNNGVTYLFIDTAGRLHTKHNLMEELKKIKRVLQRTDPTAPHETLLVLDAGIGQNNIAQARAFTESIDISGIVLTKLDGTAKGGSLFPLYDELKIPIKFIGVGESADDLQPFDSDTFIDALFSV